MHPGVVCKDKILGASTVGVRIGVIVDGNVDGFSTVSYGARTLK